LTAIKIFIINFPKIKSQFSLKDSTKTSLDCYTLQNFKHFKYLVVFVTVQNSVRIGAVV